MRTLRGGARYYVDERDPKVCSIPTISLWSASKLVSPKSGLMKDGQAAGPVEGFTLRGAVWP